jgi:hypothetical protein
VARHRHEQDLADDAMDAVAQSAVGELECEHRHCCSGEDEAERGREHEEWQHRERAADADAIEQARGDDELDD